jgi:hypothetical protein
MKVGIFGDSYGDPKERANGLAWPEMLAKSYGIDLENHSKSASSIWYSYNEFKTHQHKYDKIVFLVTGHGRITLPLPPRYTDPRLIHITGNGSGFNHIINSNDPYKKDLYLKRLSRVLQEYYLYIHHSKKDEETNRLMYEEIKRVRPDALLIPCFKNSMFNTDISLWDVCHLDMQHYKIPEKYAVERENRHCHMNQENNAILAGKINDWIKGKEFVLDPADFTTPSENVDYYFLKN